MPILVKLRTIIITIVGALCFGDLIIPVDSVNVVWV